MLKGSLLDDDDDEADDQFGTPTKSSAAGATRVESCRRAGSGASAAAHHQGHGAEYSAVRLILRVPSRRFGDAIPGGTEGRRRAHVIHDAQANHLETHSDALEAGPRICPIGHGARFTGVHAALCLGGAAPVLRRPPRPSCKRRRRRGAAPEVETKRRAKFSRSTALAAAALLRAVPGLVDPPAPFTPTFAPDERELPCISVEDLREDGAPRSRADSSDSASAPQTQASSHHSSDVAMEEKEGSLSDDDHDDDDEQALRAGARLERAHGACRRVRREAARRVRRGRVRGRGGAAADLVPAV